MTPTQVVKFMYFQVSSLPVQKLYRVRHTCDLQDLPDSHVTTDGQKAMVVIELLMPVPSAPNFGC